MNYRLANKKDLPGVVDFLKLVDNDFVPPLSKRFDIRKEVKSLFEHGEKFLLLEKKGKFIGLLSFSEKWAKTPDAWITFLVVHPAFREKFFGRNLIAQCFNILIGDKSPKVVVRTWSTNQKALELYDKQGFKITKGLKDDRGKDLDTILLEKPVEEIKIIIKKGKHGDTKER